MRVKEFKTKYNDIYLIPISDTHIGDKAFENTSERKLKGYIDWIKKTPNAYCILNGDILNVATRGSKTSPFEQNLDLKDQIEKAVQLFKPIKEKILGAIDGNHCVRISDFTGYSPMISLCERLNIDYMKDSAVYLLRLGCRKNNRSPRATFTIYSHHGNGGGKTPGSKMNRIDCMRSIVANADVFIGSHTHMLGAIPAITQIINEQTGKVELVRQMLVDTGSYLEWNNSYAERLMLQPCKLGSPRIHLIVKRKEHKDIETIEKDVHVSL